MKQKKRVERVDTSPEAAPLTSNPFAALAGLGGSVPPVPEPVVEAREEKAADAAPPSPPLFRVQRTKKGGFPVFVEKRPGGKTVTVVRNVSGDLEAMLKVLRKRIGAGGAVRDGAIEIQGEHRERIEGFLREQGA